MAVAIPPPPGRAPRAGGGHLPADEQISARAPHPEARPAGWCCTADWRRWNQAIILMKRSLTVDPANPLTHNILGELHRMRNVSDLAAACFARAVSLSLIRGSPAPNLRAVTPPMGATRRPRLLCRDILKLRPQDESNAHFELGNAFLHRLRPRTRNSVPRKRCVEALILPRRVTISAKRFRSKETSARAIACTGQPRSGSRISRFAFQCGITLQQQGELAPARVALHKALIARPQDRRGAEPARRRFPWQGSDLQKPAPATPPRLRSSPNAVGTPVGTWRKCVFCQQRFADAEAVIGTRCAPIRLGAGLRESGLYPPMERRNAGRRASLRRAVRAIRICRSALGVCHVPAAHSLYGPGEIHGM